MREDFYGLSLTIFVVFVEWDKEILLVVRKVGAG